MEEVNTGPQIADCSADNMSLSNIQRLLTNIVEQNKTLIQQNERLKDENRKIFAHFTKEFIALKNTVKQAMAEIKRQQLLTSTLPSLPLSNVDDILNFDQQINEDENKRIELIARFKKETQDDVRKFISNNLKLIFIDDVCASKFSWSNVHTNIAVKDFNFIKILKDLAVECIPHTTHSKVEANIRKFFNLAKDRLNKSYKRKRDVEV